MWVILLGLYQKTDWACNTLFFIAVFDCKIDPREGPKNFELRTVNWYKLFTKFGTVYAIYTK